MARNKNQNRKAASQVIAKPAVPAPVRVGTYAKPTLTKRIEGWKPWIELALAVVAAFALYFTWYQSNMTHDQLVAMNESNRLAAEAAKREQLAYSESNKLAIESAEREQRAYIVALTNERPQLSYTPADGQYKFEIKVKNSGNTPAHRAVTRMKVFHLPPNGKGPSYDDAPKDLPMSIGPDQEVVLLDTDNALDEDSRKFQADGSRVFWVVGQVDYEDVFGTTCFTKFRFRQGPHADASKPDQQKFDMSILDVLSD